MPHALILKVLRVYNFIHNILNLISVLNTLEFHEKTELKTHILILNVFMIHESCKCLKIELLKIIWDELLQ